MKAEIQVIQYSCSPHTPARMTTALFLVFLVFGAKNYCIVDIEFLSDISEVEVEQSPTGLGQTA